MYNTLLVDDREIFTWEAKRMRAWGEKTGFQVADTAKNGHEALERLHRSRFDLVITDIRMPLVDGIELLRRIKREGLCSCVVLLSEYSEFEYARRGLVLGAFDYIVKPLTETTLRNTLLRVREFLEETGSDSPENSRGSREYEYLAMEEKRIVASILSGGGEAVALFRRAADNIGALLGLDAPRLAKAVNQLYLSLLSGVVGENGWLESFANLSPLYEQYHSGGPIAERVNDYADKLERLTSLLGRFKPVTGGGIIPDVCDYVIRHVESHLTLKLVADSLFVNHTYLSNKFKQETGTYFIDYVTFVKMERARHLLETTEFKSYEISAFIGFSDPEYFSRLFKKHVKCSPAEYKKRLSRGKAV